MASAVALADARIWPKGDKDCSALLRVLITLSESPSTIKEEQPSSRVKEIARAAAKASTTSEEWGRGICWESEARTCPWSLQITTPRPAFPISLKVAPSKFTLRVFAIGGDHHTHGGEGAERRDGGVNFAWQKSWRASCEFWATCVMG